MRKNYFLFIALLISTLSFGQSVTITRIVDGGLPSDGCSGTSGTSSPKAIELYVDGTIDFTGYTYDLEPNGGTISYQTVDLSAFGSVSDQFVYVVTLGEITFNEILPGVTKIVTSSAQFNGNDYIRITDGTNILDEFGVLGEDGTGKPWEYLDSYVKRISGNTANSTFTIGEWQFGTVNELDGVDCSTLSSKVDFGGYTTTASTTPDINVSGSVSSLDYYEGNGPSNEGSFNVSGSNLTSDITITAPTNFEVSLTSGSGFSGSTTISPSSGTVASTIVYVRLSSGLTANTYSGSINISSTGATSEIVALTGTVSPANPQITVTAFLDPLTYIFGNGPSTADSFTVEGLFLTSDITINAPTSFEVSLASDSGYGSSVIVSHSSGTVTTTSIYIRLISGLSVGDYSGDITISSTGVNNETVSVSGNVYGPPTKALIITGVYDGPLTGGIPKGIELYATENIPDLSKFGISSITNGAGSSNGNIEYIFPNDAISTGTFIYLSTEVTGFSTFFGFVPTYTDGVVSINGDDSIELYENGQIIDTFGDVNADGSGTDWDYLDGWAYRKANNGPNATFATTDWIYSGIDALDGESTNATATTPFPLGSFTYSTASVRKDQIKGFNVFPNPVNNGKIWISTQSNATKQVKVFDILGKQLITTDLVEREFNISKLTSGIYILKVVQEGKIATRKLVVK